MTRVHREHSSCKPTLGFNVVIVVLGNIRHYWSHREAH